MKFFLSVVFLMIAVAAVAQEQPKPATSDGPLFFPKNWIWGWAQFDLAPPHNEIDPNLCASNSGDFGGKDAPAQVLVLWSSQYSVWQERAAYALHVVVGWHRVGAVLGGGG